MTEGRQRAALVLAANVLFILCVAVFDFYIDLRRVHWVYVSECGYLMCVVPMFVYTFNNNSKLC